MLKIHFTYLSFEIEDILLDSTIIDNFQKKI